MCDSRISKTCPADFTSYCPANVLCSADIGPQKRLRHSSRVRSQVAWLHRRAKGLSFPLRQGISSQPRIKPLGVAEGEQSSLKHGDRRLSWSIGDFPLEWNWSNDSSSSEDEDPVSGALKDGPWLHEQPLVYASPEELVALRGCVSRGRALFSPTPATNPALGFPPVPNSLTVCTPTDSDVACFEQDPPTEHPGIHSSEEDDHEIVEEHEQLQRDPYTTVGDDGLPEVPTVTLERPSMSPSVSENSRNSWHDRQGSFEYDHLENFSPDSVLVREEGITESNRRGRDEKGHLPRPSLDACSVSVQFGNTGYECQAVCEPEVLEEHAKDEHSSSQLEEQKCQEQACEDGKPVPFATITRSQSTEYNNLHLCHSVNLHHSDKHTTGAPSPQNGLRDRNGSGDNCIGVRAFWQQLCHSQSTPGRLNSPRFSPKHAPISNVGRTFQAHTSSSPNQSPTHRSMWRHPTTTTGCHTPSPVIYGAPLIEELDSSRCNSWPRKDLSPSPRASPYPTASQSCSTRRRTIESPQNFNCPVPQSLCSSRCCHTPPLWSGTSTPDQIHRHTKSSSTMIPSYPAPSQLEGQERQQGIGVSLRESGEAVGSVFSVKSMSSLCSRYSLASSARCDREHASYVKGVDGRVFRERMETLLSWFGEFNDQQRNSMLMKLLDQCNCSQMHLLSVHMEPILHDSCPHNCQDLLSWLPHDISLHILSFLDPVSLCRASQVSHSWYSMATNPKLWMVLVKLSKWELSPAGEAKHLQMFTLPDGTVQWRHMFAERFRIRRNWLKGYCNVRTFEGHTQGISCIQFDDTRIVSGSWDKTIKVWNRRTNTAWAALTLAGHSGTVRCLHLHGNRLVSGSSDRTIKVWDLATDKVGWVGATCRVTMVGHMHTVRCLQADDEKVISGSYDLTLKVWDIRTGHCKLTLRGHTDAVLCVQFDKEKVVSGSKDTTIKVWSLPAGECKLTLHGHQAAVSCLQFDDTRIISGALDRLIKIWNICTGECIRTIDWIRSEGHTGVVRYLQADSWKIVSAADDKTLKVWSVNTGERLLTLKSHTDGVTCLQFNDEVIVSGSYDKTVKLWDFTAC